VNAYFSVWKGRKADKEILYYAMIDIALRFVSESKRNDVAPYDDILKTITSEIEAVL
jgi:cell division protein ZapA